MSTIKVNAITDASGGNTATINGIPLRQGVLDPENRIINGAFDFWQRGTSFTTAGYSSDRWIAGFTTGTVTTSRQSFTLGDTLGTNNPTYFMRQTVSGQSTTAGYSIIGHRIESVRSYAGQTITILGWARRSSGTGNMAVELFQYYGTGGTPSATTLIAPATVTLTGSWAPFAVTLSVPSISGKTLGTNSNDYLSLQFWTSAGTDFNSRTNSLGLQTIGVDLWGIHIKVGTHAATAATDLYTAPELGPELARCQRYYWAGLPSTSLNFNSYTANAIGSWPIMFPVTMRTTPATSTSLAGATYTQCTFVGFDVPTPNGARFILQSSATSINPNVAFAAGNLLIADAEL